MSDERGEMTPRDMDELASAYLDGQVTAEEAALVEGDPRLQALVEELRAVPELLATPVDPPSDEMQNQMIARALEHRAAVVSLEAARGRRRSIPARARVVLAAAAVVAAIAMVSVTLFDQATDDDAAEQFAVDSAAVPVMADESNETAPESAPAEAAPADDESNGTAPESAPAETAPADDESNGTAPESAPAETAPASQPESADEIADFAEELADSSSSGASAEEEAPAELMNPMEDPDEDVSAAENPVMAEESPAEDDLAEESPMEAPIEAPYDVGSTMADDTEDFPTSVETLWQYDTEADLVSHVLVLALELIDAQSVGGADEAAPMNLVGCPPLLDEELELLIGFDALLQGVEVQVSVYLGKDELQIIQTSPAPECELFSSLSFPNRL
ncbi:anti-sigma factor family protein [Candidatus Poriferisocius sp.]|uniref:anti-sigma factor family protein n=1 Tax=Candidatus Poriferisocius sp. TaxID=3101276 RepID=UPI003B022887